jgi:hypothetical protein
MQEFISSAVKNLGISESVAKTSTSHVLKFIQGKLGGGDFSSLLEKLPGASALMGSAEEEKSAGGGGLFGGLASAASSLVGGSAGEGLELAGKLKDSGLDADKVGGFASQLIGFIKEKAGGELVDKIVSAVPMLKQYMG